MDRIQLWTVVAGRDVEQADELTNTETEALLEDLLVASPSILMPRLKLVARQLPTAGGPLDLLGVDEDGQLVLFELKRGALTRDAVAQILDYTSYLAGQLPDALARLIEQNSGVRGIEEFEDFLDWIQREYPDAPELLEREPRMVLVGLGADERAQRIVNFLASSGIDIQLLTFHAFQVDGRLILARMSQTVDQKAPTETAAGTKAGNLRILTQLAAEYGVEELLFQVADFVERHLAGAYRWPGKTAVSFSLGERTEEGRPTYRTYAVVHVDRKRRGKVLFSVNERAIEATPQGVRRFIEAIPEARRTESGWTPVELPINQANWSSVQDPIRDLLKSLLDGWRIKTQADEGNVHRAEDAAPPNPAVDDPRAEGPMSAQGE